MTGRIITALALCAAAALLLLLAVNTTSWASRSRGPQTLSVGLTGVKQCHRSQCRSRPFSRRHMRRSEDKLMVAAGQGVLYFGYLNVLLLAVAALLIGLRNGAAHILARVALFTLIFGLLQGTGYVVLIIAASRGSPAFAPGFSAILFFLASVAGIVGGALGWTKLQAAAPRSQPAGLVPPMERIAALEQTLSSPPPAQPAVSPDGPTLPPTAGVTVDPQVMAGLAAQPYKCQTCGQPLRYLPEYQRYYCDTCKHYM